MKSEQESLLRRGQDIFHKIGIKSEVSFFSFKVFVRQRYHTDIAAVKICPKTVATAAPVMPIFMGNIKIGSSMIFKTAPETVASIANFGLPSERIMGI